MVVCTPTFARAISGVPWLPRRRYDPVAGLVQCAHVDGYSGIRHAPAPEILAPLPYLPKRKKLILGLVTSKSGALEKAMNLIRRIDEAR